MAHGARVLALTETMIKKKNAPARRALALHLMYSIFADGIRWTNGANRNKVIKNKITMGDGAAVKYAMYMSEFLF